MLARAKRQMQGTNSNVNWLYRAYIPKDVPLRALTPEQRWKLYVRMTYTTPGIYIKTVAFTIRDQVTDISHQWGDGGEGFAKRLGSREAQFVLQNSFTALGDGLGGYEVRYDRCRCSGFWHRTGHAFVRNFVTPSDSALCCFLRRRSDRRNLAVRKYQLGGESIPGCDHPGLGWFRDKLAWRVCT